jgi:hypothetical protein
MSFRTLERRVVLVASFAAVLSLAAASQAGDVRGRGGSSRFPAAPGARLGAVDPLPNTYGAGTVNILRFPAVAFYPTYQDGTTTYYYNGMSRYMGAGYGDFGAPLQLPSGAKILGLELYANDSSTVNDVCLLLLIGDPTTGTGLNYGGPCTTGSSGSQAVYQDFTSDNITIDNVNTMYELDVSFGVMNQNNELYSVAVFYTLQVSPAPLVASFVDVPTSSPIFKFVEALKASGITGGCDATHYCPAAPLTRGQMAVFLATALGLQWE